MRPEAQAILMAAGPGSRMTSVSFKAKCLLPIGNYPMIYYSLKFLQDSGFDEVTIIVNEKEEREIKKLNEVYGLNIKLDLAPVNTSYDPGTAESLKSIESKIKANVDEVVILSSDLITDVSLPQIMNFHRSRGAALTILSANQNSHFLKVSTPGPKSKMNISSDIICTEEDNSQLVLVIAGGDYDDTVSISSRVLHHFPAGIDLATNAIDGHLYILKRQVLNYILHKESPCAQMGSLKAEVIPHIISEQFTKTMDRKGLHQFLKKGHFEDLIIKYNSSIIPSRFHSSSRLDNRVCYAFHHPGLCVRVNTMDHLWQVNTQFHAISEKLGIRYQKDAKSATDEISNKAQICDLTLIGRSTKIAEKTNISQSVIGNHCSISPMVRISNSVLFDYLHIESGCIIENSLICSSIEKKCVIKNCIVSDASKVAANGTYENELLEKGMIQDYAY